MNSTIAERCREHRDATIPQCHWCDHVAFYDFGGPLLCAPCAAKMLRRCQIGDGLDVPDYLQRTQ